MAILGLGSFDFLSSLTVNPDMLRTKAAIVQGKIKEMRVSFEALENTIRKTQNYWIGEAGDAHRDFFYNHREEIEEIFKRLTEDVADLNQMAGVYTEADNEAKEMAEELPADVII